MLHIARSRADGPAKAAAGEGHRRGIERSFSRLKDFRRIATRFGRNAKNFMAALCLAAVVTWWC